MKVFHCLNYFLPNNIGGTEVYVFNLCREQQKRNYSVKVVIPNYSSTVEETYHYEGLTVVKYPEPSIVDRALITGQRRPDGLEAFARYIQKEEPDIVHFHEIAGSNGITISHLEAAKQAGAKVVFTIHLANATCRAGTLMLKTKRQCDGVILEHRCAYCTLLHKTNSKIKSSALTTAGMILSAAGIDSIKWNNSFGTALSYPYQIRSLKTGLRRITKACNKIIALTDWYYNILLLNNVPREKLQIVSQALPHSLNYSVERGKIHSIPKRLIFVGRIDPLKGVQLLVDVITKFTPEELEIDIYGVATDSGFYRKCINATTGLENLRWKGKLDKDEVVTTMKRYDCLILPSMFSEMSPLVVQEAFAAGIPVIGSNVYGISEQVKHGVTGLLFQFGNLQSLHDTLSEIVDNPEALSDLARNIKPVRLFKEVADETTKVYEDVL